MRILNRKTNLDFIGRRKIAFALSAILIVLSISSLVVRGLNFGLDFTGGALIEVPYSEAPDLENVRDSLNEFGLSDAVVQTFGLDTEIVVRIPPREESEGSAELSTDVLQALQSGFEGTVDMRTAEKLGQPVYVKFRSARRGSEAGCDMNRRSNSRRVQFISTPATDSLQNVNASHGDTVMYRYIERDNQRGSWELVDINS